MTIEIVWDSRGRGSRWRDTNTGKWAVGPIPIEGVTVEQGRRITLEDDYKLEPPIIDDFNWVTEWDIEVEARGEGT